MIEKKRLKAFNSMSSTRVPKVEDFLKKEISQIISFQVRDPRYKFLNIVDVKCSSDLGVATVFYTIINGDVSDSPDYKSLEKFASMIRSKLSRFMQIRRVPKLIFKYDKSLERYNNIDALLNSLSDGNTIPFSNSPGYPLLAITTVMATTTAAATGAAYSMTCKCEHNYA